LARDCRKVLVPKCPVLVRTGANRRRRTFSFLFRFVVTREVMLGERNLFFLEEKTDEDWYVTSSIDAGLL